MNVNATILGPFVIFFVLVIGWLSYYLARRKTNTPVIAGIVGALLAFIPPLALIYLAVLVFKKDIAKP